MGAVTNRERCHGDGVIKTLSVCSKLVQTRGNVSFSLLFAVDPDEKTHIVVPTPSGCSSMVEL